MDAAKFPITTGYGQVAGYPLNNGWHRGEDRAMPMDTPIVVNGIEIGLSGNTGATTGPHLHIGRWLGGTDTNPNGGGFNFGRAVVTEVSQDPINGKFIRLTADGASWVYLHLSRQLVGVGQELVRQPVAAPAAPSQKYQVVEEYPGGKLIQLNKDTSLWGMNFDFDFMVSHPVEAGHQQGEVWEVTNKVHHVNGYDYYRRDGQVDGFNVLDCNDYTPPPVYVPPAAPVPVPLAERYQLNYDVPAYETSDDAWSKRAAKGILKPGNYFVYDKKDKLYNLADLNGVSGMWVNIDNNVAPPVVIAPVVVPISVTPPKIIDTIKNASEIADKLAEPVKPAPPKPTVIDKADTSWMTISYFMPDKRAIPYKSTNTASFEIYDLANKQYVDLLHPGQPLKLVGTFSRDGRLYGVPQACEKHGIWPNVPMRMVKVDLARQFYEMVKRLPVVDKFVKRIDGIFK